MATLRVKTGPNRGKVFEIKDQVLTLGRDESQTIQILDQGVSRSHAEIFRLGDACFVRDLDSTNGTFVNNLKVAEETLKNGDELLIGTTILVFEDGPPTEARQEGADYKSGTTTISLKAASKAGKPVTREVDSRNLAGMTEIGKILGASQDLKSSLQRVVETLAALIKAEQGYLYMTDAAAGKLAAMASVEHGEPRGEKKVSRTIVNRVMKSCAPTLTPDATLDDRFTLSESIVLKKVKSVIAVPVTIRGLCPGDAYVINNPYNGGTHLPDLTLVMPVFDTRGTCSFFVAARGHHADVGGRTPGSMPPDSRTLEEEGILFDSLLVVEDGTFRETQFRAALAAGHFPARDPDRNIADLRAQIAACARGAAEIDKMVGHFGLDVVLAYMRHVQDNAAEAVRRVLDRL
jgi:pSer/pThr/pTyr-binding forkhead associated (FHA) protein